MILGVSIGAVLAVYSNSRNKIIKAKNFESTVSILTDIKNAEYYLNCKKTVKSNESKRDNNIA